MLETLTGAPPTGVVAGVRFAEVIAALLDEAQRRDPARKVDDVAKEAGVHPVSLRKILAAARAGRPHAVDEETFWDVCRVLGQGPGDMFTADCRARVDAWRRALSLPPTETTRTSGRARRS